MRTMIAPPAPGRVRGQWVYAMIYGGCQWILVVSGHGSVSLGETFSETGRLVLLTIDFMELRTVSALASRR